MAKVNKSSAQYLKKLQLREKILAARVKGWSYPKISREIGCAMRTAFTHVHDALAELRASNLEKTEEYRDIEVMRLDDMLAGVWEKASTGDTAAIAAALKIGDQRNKLLGLNEPQKHTVELDGLSGALSMAFQEAGLEIETVPELEADTDADDSDE